MKNNTNIYDIDGEIIRKVGDNHEFLIQEVQEKIKYYNDKLKDEIDKKKAVIYRTYIVNLTNYAAYLMSKMSKTELVDLISAAAPKKTSSEEVEKALTDIEVVENGETKTLKLDEEEYRANKEFIGKQEAKYFAQNFGDLANVLNTISTKTEDIEEVEAEYIDAIPTGNGLFAQIREIEQKLENERKEREQKESEYVDFVEV